MVVSRVKAHSISSDSNLRFLFGMTIVTVLFMVSMFVPNYLDEQTAIAENTTQAPLKTANVNEVKGFIYYCVFYFQRSEPEFKKLKA